MSNEVQKFFAETDAQVRHEVRRMSRRDRIVAGFTLATVALSGVAYVTATRMCDAAMQHAPPRAQTASTLLNLFAAFGLMDFVWPAGKWIGRRVAAWWIK